MRWRLAAILGAIALALNPGGAARGQDVNAVQALTQNAANWVNAVGRHWACTNSNQPCWWANVSPAFAPSLLAFTGSQVVYGPPSGANPAQPTAIESLIAVNCGGPGSEPQVIKMLFNQTVTKTATTTVTQGVTVGESLMLQASVPSWGVGVSETTSVSYSTTTSSSASTTVAYAYSYEDDVTLNPGLKQTANLVVDFQDTIIPWSANVQYTGGDTIAGNVVGWMNFSIEPEGRGEQVANYFTSEYGQTPLRSVLSTAAQTFQASGNFTGVSGSQGTAVNGPTEELTPADKAQYCGGAEAARAAGRVFRIPVQRLPR